MDTLAPCAEATDEFLVVNSDCLREVGDVPTNMYILHVYNLIKCKIIYIYMYIYIYFSIHINKDSELTFFCTARSGLSEIGQDDHERKTRNSFKSPQQLPPSQEETGTQDFYPQKVPLKESCHARTPSDSST